MSPLDVAVFLFLICETVGVNAEGKGLVMTRQSRRWTKATYQQEAVGIISKLCTCLVQRLAWERVILLFDKSGESIVQAMMTYWSDTQIQIPVQIICVDSFHSDGSVSNLLGDLYHSVPHLNVIFIARLAVVSSITKEVNDYDLFSNRTTDFGHRSKWIVVSEISVRENLTVWAKDLENVAFLPAMKMNGRLTKQLKLFTIVHPPSGPTLTPVRFVNCNLTVDDVFPNIKYKYNGKQLVVVRTEEDSFTSVSVNTSGRVTHRGYGVDILDLMAKYLNFTYIMKEPEDKQWGLLVNGSWTGIVGVLARREADLQISSLTIHEDRAQVMHFLQPPVYIQLMDVIYKRADVIEGSWFAYVTQFRPVVFLCIGLSAAVFSLLFVLTESCRPAQQTTRSTKSSSCPNALLLFSQSFWYTVSSVAQGSQSITTRTTSSSIIVASWRLFLIVTTAAYTANLMAELTSKKPRVPFRNLGELVDNKDFTFGISGGDITSLIFKKTKSGVIKRAWTTLQERAKTDPNILRPEFRYHTQRVVNGKYGWICSRKYGNLIREKYNCSVVFMNSPFNWQLLSFGVPIASPYITDFEYVLSLLYDSGTLNVIQNKWFPSHCDDEIYISQSARTLGMDDVKGVFAFSAAGIGLAFVVLLFEIISACASAHVLNR